MILIDNFKEVIAQIETERGISKESIITAIEQAIASACKRNHNQESNLIAKLDENGEASVYEVKTVVGKVEDDNLEINLPDAKALVKDVKIDDEIEIQITPPEFGRLAAQTAKQVIVQRIREAEKNSIYDDFINRVGTIITGTVQRIENRNYLINLGRTEAILNFRNQIPGESFSLKEKVRVYVEDIEKTPKGSFIRISRTHTGFLKTLFENEIPEIKDGIIEIMSISRDPGKRAKVAVKSNNPTIGAVGTCVGHMGARIQTIIKELSFEKIDVLEWYENPSQFISSALKPAKISQVIITNEEEKEATVIVPKDQLSLAIGKAGINVRLSVQLTGWKLDILNEDEYNNKAAEIHSDNHVSIIDRIKEDRERQNSEEAAQDVTKTEHETQESESNADVVEANDEERDTTASLDEENQEENSEENTETIEEEAASA